MHKDKSPAPRGRSVRGAKRSVALMFTALAVAAVASPFLHQAKTRAPDPDTAQWIATLAARTAPEALQDPDAAELSRRFRDKVQTCTGISAGAWPLRLEPGAGDRLTLKYAREVTPALSVDLRRLKEEGLQGDYARLAAETEAPRGAARQVLMAGLLGVVAPQRPCPPKS